ncbi:MAG: glycosyltransferase family 39 protein [Gemmatimonadaceae bacterium]
MQSFRTPFPETLSVFPGDNKHPLYSLLAHVSLTAFGESAWSVRLPAMLLGVATIPALYALGVRITSRAEALAASALLALSYHHVWFSQNARGYSALAFFAVVATWILLQALRTDEYRLWIWYGIAAGLGAYTHLTFVFTVVGQFLVVVAAVLGWPSKDRRISWRAPLAGFALSAVLAVVLYLPMFSSVMAFFLHKQSNLRGISSPSWALTEAFRVLRLGFGGAFGIGLVVLAVGAAIGIAGAVSYARQNLRTFLLLVLPAVTTLMGAFAARGTMYPRFFFVLAGFALLIGIRGAFEAGAWLASRLRWSEVAGYRLGAGIAAAVVLVSALSVPLNWRAPKQDFEGAAQYAERSAGPDDAIVTADVTTSVYSTYYQKSWKGIHTAADLDSLRHADPATGAAGHRVWFIYAFPRYLERFDASLAAYVRDACTGGNIQRFPGTVGDGDLLVCRLERT